MQMMSPYQFREMNKDKSLDELILLKKQLQSDINKLLQENNNSPFLSDTRLQVKQLYLDEISNLIGEKSTNSEETT